MKTETIEVPDENRAEPVADPGRSTVARCAIIRSDLTFLAVLGTASLMLGLLLNQFREIRLPLVYQDKESRILQQTATIPQSEASAPAFQSNEPEVVLQSSLSLAEVQSLQRSSTILDARPEIFHRLGHIPGAISLPRDDFENAYPLVRDRLEESKSQPLIIYCASSSCEDAELVRKALTRLGYTNMGIFTGGWAEWSGAGLPEERND